MNKLEKLYNDYLIMYEVLSEFPTPLSPIFDRLKSIGWPLGLSIISTICAVLQLIMRITE